MTFNYPLQRAWGIMRPDFSQWFAIFRCNWLGALHGCLTLSLEEWRPACWFSGDGSFMQQQGFRRPLAGVARLDGVFDIQLGECCRR